MQPFSNKPAKSRRDNLAFPKKLRFDKERSGEETSVVQ